MEDIVSLNLTFLIEGFPTYFSPSSRTRILFLFTVSMYYTMYNSQRPRIGFKQHKNIRNMKHETSRIFPTSFDSQKYGWKPEITDVLTIFTLHLRHANSISLHSNNQVKQRQANSKLRWQLLRNAKSFSRSPVPPVAFLGSKGSFYVWHDFYHHVHFFQFSC